MSSNQSIHFESAQKELEAVRIRFLRLLERIQENDWNRRLPGEGWTIRQEMTHIVQVVKVLPRGIQHASRGGGRSMLAVVPTGLRSWINGYLIIPWMARNATRQSITEDYNKAHTHMLELLKGLPEEDWSKSTPYPRQVRTIEQLAHRPVEHFKEHESHLSRILGIKAEVTAIEIGNGE